MSGGGNKTNWVYREAKWRKVGHSLSLDALHYYYYYYYQLTDYLTDFAVNLHAILTCLCPFFFPP